MPEEHLCLDSGHRVYLLPSGLRCGQFNSSNPPESKPILNFFIRPHCQIHQRVNTRLFRLLRAEEGSAALTEALAAARVEYRDIPVYRTVYQHPDEQPRQSQWFPPWMYHKNQ